MNKIKYIILPLTLLMLVGCVDETKEEVTGAVATATQSPSTNNTGNCGASERPERQDTLNPDTTESPATQDTVASLPRKIRPRLVKEEDNETEVITKETIPSNWYIRIVAEDSHRSLKTNLSQLGALEESDAVQKHTLVSGGRFSNPYLDVVFVDPDGMPAGDYKTNYHVYGEGIDDRWRFTVETDDVNAEIRLSWKGLYVLTPSLDTQNRMQYAEYRSGTNPLIAKMKLIDSTTGTEIPAILNDKVQTYLFTMDGQVTRNFEWVIHYD